MREGHTYRAGRKRIAKEQYLDRSLMTWDCDPSVGPGKHQRWLSRHPKLAPFYTLAVGMLTTGPRSQQPSWRAVKKIMANLATCPRVVVPGLGRVPYLMMLQRHDRLPWRQLPKIRIDANLEVAQ